MANGGRGKRAGGRVAAVERIDQLGTRKAANRHLPGERSLGWPRAKGPTFGLPFAVVGSLEVGNQQVFGRQQHLATERYQYERYQQAEEPTDQKRSRRVIGEFTSRR